MNKSPNYDFFLPSRDADDIVDIDQLSSNFNKIDAELPKMLKGDGVDQSYKPESKNPQSGTAVASALANYLPLDTELQLELDGGNAGAELDVEYVVDSNISDTSPNPVENRVIKHYVDALAAKTNGIIDYPIEEGVSGIWNYRKWKNGVVELWGESAYTCTAHIDRGGEVRYSENLPFPLIGKIHTFIHPSALAYRVRKAYQLDSTANELKMFAKLEDAEGLLVGDQMSFLVSIKSRWK